MFSCNSSIAYVYADALYKNINNKKIDCEDNFNILLFLIKNESFCRILRGISISGMFNCKLDDIGSFLRNLNVDECFINLFLLMVQSNKVSMLPEVCYFFKKITTEALGKVMVCVKTAMPLKVDDLVMIREYFSNFIHKEVEVENIVSINVIGGMIFEFENKTIDLSYVNVLNYARNSLREYLDSIDFLDDLCH